MSLYLFGTLSVTSFLVQLLSVFIVFRKVDSTNNTRYRFFQAQFLVTWAVFFYVSSQSTPDASPIMWASSAILIGCLALFFYCSALIRKNKLTIVFSEDSPEFHINKGPYSFVRHPFYTSYIFTYFALAISLQHWAFSAMAFSMFLTYFFAARYEEKKFESSKLGESYSRYRAGTGMFLPKVTKRISNHGQNKKAA